MQGGGKADHIDCDGNEKDDEDFKSFQHLDHTDEEIAQGYHHVVSRSCFFCVDWSKECSRLTTVGLHLSEEQPERHRTEQ
jgi:hypothetical protein